MLNLQLLEVAINVRQVAGQRAILQIEYDKIDDGFARSRDIHKAATAFFLKGILQPAQITFDDAHLLERFGRQLEAARNFGQLLCDGVLRPLIDGMQNDERIAV